MTVVEEQRLWTTVVNLDNVKSEQFFSLWPSVNRNYLQPCCFYLMIFNASFLHWVFPWRSKYLTSDYPNNVCVDVSGWPILKRTFVGNCRCGDILQGPPNRVAILRFNMWFGVKCIYKIHIYTILIISYVFGIVEAKIRAYRMQYVYVEYWHNNTMCVRVCTCVHLFWVRGPNSEVSNSSVLNLSVVISECSGLLMWTLYSHVQKTIWSTFAQTFGRHVFVLHMWDILLVKCRQVKFLHLVSAKK